MYLTAVEVVDFRGLETLTWALEPGDTRPGWHVLVGDNGSGKSSVLRAIALALIGPGRASALRLNLNDWVRFGTGHAEVSLRMGAKAGAQGGRLAIRVVRHPHPEVVAARGGTLGAKVWRGSAPQVFASYGPFRRFTGGDREAEKLAENDPRVARHLSLFSESVALTAGLAWLRHGQSRQAYAAVKAKGRRKKRPLRGLVAEVVEFLNGSKLLPRGAYVDEVTPDEVIFRDGAGARVPAESLSDGQRSILSLALDLLRQLSIEHEGERLTSEGRVRWPGVVLIDEVDAHLHPTWQRTIGPWFVEHFPKVQFIVTTHSPLVCQAADHGTVFRLPTPGSGETARFLRGVELQRLLYGDASEAYGTGAFGVTSTRSDEGRSAGAPIDAGSGECPSRRDRWCRRDSGCSAAGGTSTPLDEGSRHRRTQSP